MRSLLLQAIAQFRGPVQKTRVPPRSPTNASSLAQSSAGASTGPTSPTMIASNETERIRVVSFAPRAAAPRFHKGDPCAPLAGV